jgi:hypothetical protein
MILNGTPRDSPSTTTAPPIVILDLSALYGSKSKITT